MLLAVALALVAQTACPSAADLEAALNKARAQPFVARVDAVGAPTGDVVPTGGFKIPPPTVPIGEIVSHLGPMAQFDTACGSRIVWTPAWTNGAITDASRFTVQAAPAPSPPAATYADVTYRVAFDAQGSRLLVDKAGRQVAEYRLDFRATAVSLLPDLHTAAVRVDLIGLQPDGSVIYAEFRALPPGAP